METTNASAVGNYYDTWTDRFVAVYGDTIQAHRTPDLAALHEYIMRAADLQAGQLLLDAGCGVGGPSTYFATHLDLRVHAITASSLQAQYAEERFAANGIADRATARQGDFHTLPAQFAPGTFDRIVFLESFGHGSRKDLVLAGAAEVIKTGGKLYIKDYFTKQGSNAVESAFFEQTRLNMNEAYCYDLADIAEVIHLLEQNRFEILFIRRPSFQDDYYEVVNRFQADYQVNLGLAPMFDEVTGAIIFPVNFFEILAVKR
jgi:cyclopropane fatty-acyl-phospholipid synthase-like methyltransferase